MQTSLYFVGWRVGKICGLLALQGCDRRSARRHCCDGYPGDDRPAYFLGAVDFTRAVISFSSWCGAACGICQFTFWRSSRTSAPSHKNWHHWPCRKHGRGLSQLHSRRSRFSAGDLAFLDDVLALRVVPVLHEAEHSADVLGVNVAASTSTSSFDNGMIVLPRIVPTLRVSFSRMIRWRLALDETLGRYHALGLDDPSVIDVFSLLDHFLTVVVAWGCDTCGNRCCYHCKCSDHRRSPRRGPRWRRLLGERASRAP